MVYFFLKSLVSNEKKRPIVLDKKNPLEIFAKGFKGHPLKNLQMFHCAHSHDILVPRFVIAWLLCLKEHTYLLNLNNFREPLTLPSKNVTDIKCQWMDIVCRFGAQMTVVYACMCRKRLRLIVMKHHYFLLFTTARLPCYIFIVSEC